MKSETIETLAEDDVPPWAAGTQGRDHEIFPVLNAEEMDLLRPYGEERQYAQDERVWSAGDISAFFLVLEGKIEVIRSGTDQHQTIATHGPGQYLGEIYSMTGGRAMVTGIAIEPVRALYIDPENIRRMIATEAELGEKVLLSFILRRMRMIANRLGNVTLIGDSETAAGGDLQRFLSRNGIPFDVLHPERDAQAVADRLKTTDYSGDERPLIVRDNKVLVNPTHREVAEQLGFTADIDSSTIYDVAVIGSGPAGLAAAVYAASEGLKVVVLESCAPGGQAGSSSRIENYMGFPTGISGQALMGRGYLQAQKFGAQIVLARKLTALECGDPVHKLRIDNDDILQTRAVVIASGAVYRQPDIEGLDQFGGVHYGASHVEGELCRNKNVAIVGGGNSAGQAAVYLAKRARKVNILIRSASLAHSMSDYLIQRIERLPNVELLPHTEITRINGDDTMQSISVVNNQTQATQEMDVAHLFIFIGAQAGTDFINQQELKLDSKGFVLTGEALKADLLESSGWNLDRRPYPLETSCPRVFAVGDVRSGSVKRVASAVGEGSVCIQFVHRSISDDE